MLEAPNTPDRNGGDALDARDTRGRFVGGNQAAKGRGPGDAGRVRALIRESVTDDDLRAIVATLVAEAKAGNLQAAKELLDRLAGKPKPIAEVSGQEDSEIHIVYDGGHQWTPPPGEKVLELSFDQGG